MKIVAPISLVWKNTPKRLYHYLLNMFSSDFPAAIQKHFVVIFPVKVSVNSDEHLLLVILKMSGFFTFWKSLYLSLKASNFMLPCTPKP